LGSALRTFVVYHHLNSQGFAKFLLEKDGVATLGSFVYQKGTEYVDQVYDFEIAASLSIIRELCGANWLPERALFSHTKPVDVAPYRRYFRAQCRFDCERTALLFPSRLLEFKLPEADPKKLRILYEQARARDDFGLVFRLRRSLRALLLSEAASGDEVAKLLSMHRRTLDRRLRTEGTTFKEVLDEVRFEAACQLLDGARIPITEIAASLGYAETSAFSRAFRRWSGTTPLDRRRNSNTGSSRQAR
jgi:AraC-like DNA-binding protein